MVVVLDANIYVSAVISPGSPADRLVIAAEAGAIDLVVSSFLLTELGGVLGRDKFRAHIGRDDIPAYLSELIVIGRLEPDARDAPRVTRDPKDDYLVALALAVGADLLVSGDKDLLEAGLGKPVVVTPRDAVERLGL